MDGVLFIAWTIDDKPPSVTTCSSVSKISLFLNNVECGEIEIDPIPCALDKFRYDEMPLGPAEIVLQGFDAHGGLVISGSGQVNLTATLPMTPAPIAMQ